MNFNNFCLEAESLDEQPVNIDSSVLISFENTKKEIFQISPDTIVEFINCFNDNYDEFVQAWLEAPRRTKELIDVYDEKGYRAIFKLADEKFGLKLINSIGRSQTKPLSMLVSKVICYAAGFDYVGVATKSYFDKDSLEKAVSKLSIVRLDATELHVADGKSAPLKSYLLKAEFKRWLKSEGLSDNSIKKYSEESMKAADLDVSEFMGHAFSFYDQAGFGTIELHADILKGLSKWQGRNKSGGSMYRAGLNKFLKFSQTYFSRVPLPKPFILLAGISGTGKSRFVRKQARASDPSENNYCHVAVRPDWHEPSDLLGYISRIGTEGTRYITTDVLAFIAKAWIEAVDSTDTTKKIIPKDNITPYWLCLDEMNLAPVEQYFADFLSILETREWKDGEYSCKPLMKPSVINKLEPAAQDGLRKNLGMEDISHDPLWQSFLEHGIGIPPNLIVAGTVNMDETTHGFSRKVIDRALTLDFGEFFPNDFDLFFNGQPTPKTLTCSRLTQASPDDLENVPADKGGTKSIAFLKQVNGVLKDTPFELAYRALNELLLSVVCFSPEDDDELKAVWDDFLMTKVLPRIEGDGDKLQEDGDGNNLLIELKVLLEGTGCFNGLQNRPDFLRESADENTPLLPPLRSLIKISRMNERLNSQGFTAFWP